MTKPKLSEKTIRPLLKNPPAEGPDGRSRNVVHYDGSVPGFGLRVTSAGKAAFVLNYRVDGRERRFTIGRFPEWSATAARERALELRVGLGKGEDPLAERQARRNAPTVADLADEYCGRHLPTKRPSSRDEDRSMLAHHVLPALGRRKVANVERRDVERLHLSLAETPYRANRILSLISTMWSLAEAWGYTLPNGNPARGIKRYHEEPRERWLSQEEIGRLLEALEADENRTAANAVKLMLLTGCRRGEALQARWADVDLERGVWTKPSHHTKQKKTERVPLSAAAVGLLTAMRDEADASSPWVFPSDRTGEPLYDMKVFWDRVRRAADLRGVRLHDLRHSFASHLVSSGMSLHLVGKLLGHTQSRTTERYAHASASALREAADLMGGVVESAREGLAPVVDISGNRKR